VTGTRRRHAARCLPRSCGISVLPHHLPFLKQSRTDTGGDDEAPSLLAFDADMIRREAGGTAPVWGPATLAGSGWGGGVMDEIDRSESEGEEAGLLGGALLAAGGDEFPGFGGGADLDLGMLGEPLLVSERGDQISCAGRQAGRQAARRGSFIGTAAQTVAPPRLPLPHSAASAALLRRPPQNHSICYRCTAVPYRSNWSSTLRPWASATDCCSRYRCRWVWVVLPLEEDRDRCPAAACCCCDSRCCSCMERPRVHFQSITGAATLSTAPLPSVFPFAVPSSLLLFLQAHLQRFQSSVVLRPISHAPPAPPKHTCTP
jgi:hypothetical protein